MSILGDLVKSPEVIMGAVGLIAGLIGLSVRGAKAKFADEMGERLDRRLQEHASVNSARAEVADAKIAALQADMTEVKTDVRGINAKLDKIMSNGFLGHR